MEKSPTIEDRVRILEQQVADLQARVYHAPRDENWVERISGRFENDPDFQEILRLGRELRRADRQPELDE